VSATLILVIALALLYAFINGLNDSSSIVATMISSRALSARSARLMTAVAEFLGPLVVGIAVARTIGNVVANPASLSTHVILAAILAAILWNLFTSFLGLPSSSSHGLVGGLVGAVVLAAGTHAIQVAALIKILLSLFLSPVIGFVIGFIVLKLIMVLSWEATPGINMLFKRGQILTVIALGLSHSSNDAPKTMGVITLALMTEKYISSFAVPTWVILISALAISAGTAVGRKRLVRTVGGRFYKIGPIDAFCSQLSSAVVIVTSSLLGGPVSATHVLSSSIMGVGAAERPNKVRWNLVQDIATAWLLTIPLTALLAAGLYRLITPLFH
jgi:inorganic phosphate transporter, PiT family